MVCQPTGQTDKNITGGYREIMLGLFQSFNWLIEWSIDWSVDGLIGWLDGLSTDRMTCFISPIELQLMCLLQGLCLFIIVCTVGWRCFTLRDQSQKALIFRLVLLLVSKWLVSVVITVVMKFVWFFCRSPRWNYRHLMIFMRLKAFFQGGTTPFFDTPWAVYKETHIWTAGGKSVEILLRHGRELNPDHRKDRQWAFPLSYHNRRQESVRHFFTSYSLAWSTMGGSVSTLYHEGLFLFWARINVGSSYYQRETTTTGIRTQVLKNTSPALYHWSIPLSHSALPLIYPTIP